VAGFFMLLAQPDAEIQLQRVRTLGDQLGVPVTAVDLGAPFRQKVLDYFSACYLAGNTPNPCVVCNPAIKFGELLQRVRLEGFKYMATGHYARLVRDDRVHLFKGRDSRKDQSYFLHQLGQRQLESLMFPLGEYEKTRVYELAASFGIAGMHGKESQDVCFLQHLSIPEFLEKHAASLPGPGPIYSVDGRLLGEHKGIFRYTIGQRRGLGLPDATPWYVVEINADTNQVIIGKEQDLWCRRLLVQPIHWLADEPPKLPGKWSVRIRYRHREAAAEVWLLASGRYEIVFDEQQRAVAPGQYAVIYDGDEVLGGGPIIADRK